MLRNPSGQRGKKKGGGEWRWSLAFIRASEIKCEFHAGDFGILKTIWVSLEWSVVLVGVGDWSEEKINKLHHSFITFCYCHRRSIHNNSTHPLLPKSQTFILCVFISYHWSPFISLVNPSKIVLLPNHVSNTLNLPISHNLPLQMVLINSSDNNSIALMHIIICLS